MTIYTYLSTHNNFGYPDNINLDENNNDIFNPISNDILTEVSTTLPEQNTVLDNHPDWIRKSDICTKDNCEIAITFISEGAGYKNGLSYYVYDIDNPPSQFNQIDNIYIIFPNASEQGSGGNMNIGDTMKLAYEVISYDTDKGRRYATGLNYVFPANKGIGFIISANQWKNNGTSNCFLRTGSLMYSTDPVLNREPTYSLKNHCVNYLSSVDPSKIIYGFEDIKRTASYCDHDFNDLVYCINANPITSLQPTYNSSSKQTFSGTILCEDLLNRPGADLDYNDIVVEYNINETLVNDKLTSIIIKLKGLNRGASYNHNFGVVIPNINTIDGVNIYREETITSTGVTTTYKMSNTSKFVNIIEDTQNFLPPGSYFSTNTVENDTEVLPSYSTLRIVFPDGGVDRSEIGNVHFPYNFFLKVYRPDAPHLWTIYSDQSYTDVSTEAVAAGVTTKKKIMIIPDFTNFRCALERQPLRKVYYKLLDYLGGNGAFGGWYTGAYRKTHLTYPYIEHTDTTTVREFFDSDILPVKGSFCALPGNISSTSETYIVDFSDINTSNNDILSLLDDFTKINVTYNSSTTDVNGNYYYIYNNSNTVTLGADLEVQTHFLKDN